MYAKQKNVERAKSPAAGCRRCLVWTQTAICADTKLIPMAGDTSRDHVGLAILRLIA